MNSNIKRGLIVGSIFAGIAYSITLYTGFNSTSLTAILYLYVFLAIFLHLEPEEIFQLDLFERVVLVAEDEENKLKKLFTGEEYKINGTIEKV